MTGAIHSARPGPRAQCVADLYLRCRQAPRGLGVIEVSIVHHAGRTHLKGTVFEFVLPMADKMPGAHVEPVLAQQMWGAYGDRPAQVRVRSTGREGTANNPPLNPAEWVRGGAGSVIFEIIARTGKWCREGWRGEAQR
jgi:hypothetical protein